MTCELSKEYIDARYELAFMTKGGQVVKSKYPHRFNHPPPKDVLNEKKIWKWIRENSINPVIVKP